MNMNKKKGNNTKYQKARKNKNKREKSIFI